MVPEPAPVLPAPLADARYFQFPDGRRLAFRLPESGIDMADVRRIACHLLTLAKDWAPAEDATIAVIAEVLSLPGATP